VLILVNREKLLERNPSVVESQEIASHIDSYLLLRPGVRRCGDKEKKPRGKESAPWPVIHI
jgi:hypothetical protein